MLAANKILIFIFYTSIFKNSIRNIANGKWTLTHFLYKSVTPKFEKHDPNTTLWYDAFLSLLFYELHSAMNKGSDWATFLT